MQIDLILKDGDWYATTDRDNPLSLKTIQTGKLISQTKIKKEIIFSYEFPDDTKFPKKKGRKKKTVSKPTIKTTKKNIKVEDSIDEDSNDLEAHLDEVEVETEEVEVAQVEDEESLRPKNYARRQKLDLNKKMEFFDDRTIGQADRKVKPLARAIQRSDAKTKHKYVKKHCSVCNHDEIVSEYEARIGYGTNYRCNKCCGG
jgi:hypothetical protein